jgi:hypothetical protein
MMNRRDAEARRRKVPLRKWGMRLRELWIENITLAESVGGCRFMLNTSACAFL